MVGWNVAATQLVVGVLIHKISILVFKSLQLHLIINYNEHVKFLNVCFCFHCMVMMYACFSSKHFNFYVYVHGTSCLDRYCYGSILFVGWRVGDITVWYQSYRCSIGPQRAMRNQLAEVVKRKKLCELQKLQNFSKSKIHRMAQTEAPPTRRKA